MKRTLIRCAIVLVVFIATILVTSKIVNQDFSDMTTDIAAATYPVVSIEYNGIEINRMFGYAKEMELSYMRESITPLMSGRKLRLKIDTFSSIIEGIKYEVRTVDKSRLIESTPITEYEQQGRKIEATIALKDLIDSNVEYELIVIVTLEGGREIRYYTRVINPEEYHIADKLEYVSEFTTKTFNKTLAEDLKKYLEPNSKGDNTSFGHVDIHSNFSQVTWGDLNPLRVTDPIITVKELAQTTGSFLVDYYVSTSTDGKVDYYKVREYLRIRYSKDRMYLLDYERTMDQVFVDEKESYTESDILFGITSTNESMMESEDGNTIAFTTGGRLYTYNIVDNRVAYLYGYYDIFTEDVRNMYDAHNIKVMNVDEAGNVTFLVYGYMNRGTHEGECGAAAYYYDATLNSIEELAYIPSNHAPDLLMKEIEKLSFMNSKHELYFLEGSRLYKIKTDTKELEVIADDLSDQSYVISPNNHLVAWQEGNDILDCHNLILLNLETGLDRLVKTDQTRTIMPLSFIGEDLIYGLAKKSDITLDMAGNVVVPMYQLNIENEKDGILMQYAEDNVYIISTEVNQNQIVLHRVEKDDEGALVEIMDDQILNSKDSTVTKNNFATSEDELFKLMTSIHLYKDINPAAMKHLSPKQVINENTRQIDINDDTIDDRYVVYGRYGADSFFADESLAVSRAYEISGIVLSKEGRYIYRKTTRNAKNQIMAIKAAMASEKAGPVAVCLDTMLEYEGIVRNSQYMLNQGNTVLDILLSALTEYEVLDLTGCTLDMVLFYVNMDIPVLVMLDEESSVLLIGFNDKEVVLMDPTREEIYKVSIEDATNMFEENGNCFITYLPISAE